MSERGTMEQPKKKESILGAVLGFNAVATAMDTTTPQQKAYTAMMLVCGFAALAAKMTQGHPEVPEMIRFYGADVLAMGYTAALMKKEMPSIDNEKIAYEALKGWTIFEMFSEPLFGWLNKVFSYVFSSDKPLFSPFDWKDVVAYGAGCGGALLVMNAIDKKLGIPQPSKPE